MSANSRPENDLPAIQTKNPNPPGEQPPDPGLPIGRSQEHERTASPADPSNDTNPAKSRGRPALHGLRRRKLFIAPEDAERFANFRHCMMAELDPQDHTERFFAEAIIAKRWLVLHADEAEAAAMRNAYLDADNLALHLVKSKSPNAPKSDDERYDRAIAHTCTNEKVHLVLRYRTTHERAMFRYETALRQYRLTRDAGHIADHRHESESHGGTPRADVVNHWGEGFHPVTGDDQTTDSHRKPTIADALADVSRRNSNPANPSPTTDLRPIQTNCRNSPNPRKEDPKRHIFRVEELNPTPDPWLDVTKMAQGKQKR